MPGPLKTEAVVLRSLRYGEADRILHLYPPARGRVGAIAKGVRRARSRFGGRLEPFSRVELVLHEGRSDLLTVTGADTVDAHARLREDGAALDAAARACDAVRGCSRRRAATRGLPPALQRARAARRREPARATRANQLAFRLKLLLAAGLAPQLASCASAASASTSSASPAPPAAWSAPRARRARSRSARRPTRSWSVRSARPLAQAPRRGARALRQAERAIARDRSSTTPACSCARRCRRPSSDPRPALRQWTVWTPTHPPARRRALRGPPCAWEARDCRRSAARS